MYTLLALCSSLLFGFWLFGISRYRGSISSYSVILVSSLAAALVYLSQGYVANDLLFNSFDVSRGFIGGIFNVTGVILVLKAIERGPMGVAAGIGASTALVPLAYSLVIGESLTVFAGVGILVILCGLTLFYVPSMKLDRDESSDVAAIVLSLLAALAWGLEIVVLDMGSRVSVSSTMFISEIPTIAFSSLVIAFVARSWGGLTARATYPLAAAGVALGLGQLAFYTAAQEGDVGVVSVLGSLDPIVTALLAFVILKEKLTRLQQVALVTVLVGTSLVVI